MDRPNSLSSFPTLRRRDQRTLAVILIVCLPLLAISICQTSPLNEKSDRSYHFEVDPNNATTTELRLLPGVGEKLADAIVLDRTLKGPFKIPADLQRVKGIGPKKIEALQPFLSEMKAREKE